MFADDSSVSAYGNNIAAISAKLQPSIQEVTEWCSANAVLLNPEKTKSMVVATRQKHQRGIPPLRLMLNSQANKKEKKEEKKKEKRKKEEGKGFKFRAFIGHLKNDVMAMKGLGLLENNLKLSELRSCVKVGVAVLCSPTPISLMVSVDVKQH